MALADAANAGTTEFINCILDDEPGLDLTKASQIFLRDKIAKHYFGLASRMRDRWSSRDPQSPRGPSHRTGLVGLTSGSSGRWRSRNSIP
jgi:hypothetical protein